MPGVLTGAGHAGCAGLEYPHDHVLQIGGYLEIAFARVIHLHILFFRFIVFYLFIIIYENTLLYGETK